MFFVVCCEVVIFVVVIVVDFDVVDFFVVIIEFVVVVIIDFFVVVIIEFFVVFGVFDVGGGGVDIDVDIDVKIELDFKFWLLLDWLGVGWIVLVNFLDDEVKRVVVFFMDDLGVINLDENVIGEVIMDDFMVFVFCEVGKIEVINEVDDIDVIILFFEEDIVNEVFIWIGVLELDINELNIILDDLINVEVGCELELMFGEEVDKILVLEEVMVIFDKVFV